MTEGLRSPNIKHRHAVVRQPDGNLHKLAVKNVRPIARNHQIPGQHQQQRQFHNQPKSNTLDPNNYANVSHLHHQNYQLNQSPTSPQTPQNFRDPNQSSHTLSGLASGYSMKPLQPTVVNSNQVVSTTTSKPNRFGFRAPFRNKMKDKHKDLNNNHGYDHEKLEHKKSYPNKEFEQILEGDGDRGGW